MPGDMLVSVKMREVERAVLAEGRQDWHQGSG
jgi:hypothetical protein